MNFARKIDRADFNIISTGYQTINKNVFLLFQYPLLSKIFTREVWSVDDVKIIGPKHAVSKRKSLKIYFRSMNRTKSTIKVKKNT